ncbi:AGE family epimerase/isomerase [Schaalia sp. ZJ405]|uniref:AGE family epimerase/isomerase n=1 Tax=Schaalia sp. ZJ405 TaxID=2709403 RepID=UPI0013EC817D|nr:AGE family epimerase/isomerase [Schaalia sp. ZJ405]QPK81231.1 AGE family epimerase/isomerase [Schaalia sp. ZJ405]
MGWFDSVEHNRWLSAQMQALIREAEGAIVPTGFAHLNDQGEPDPARSIDLAVTARMLYVFSLGVLMGLPGSRRYADHAVKALRNYFTDPVNGGMWTSITPEPTDDGHGQPWDQDGRGKSQYHNAYVILGLAAAVVADRPGAYELLAAVLHDQERHWLEGTGLVRDQYDEAFTEALPVRSLGTLLHTAEAYLAAAEATTDPVWLERAEIMASYAYQIGSERNWRLPEYYDETWEPLSEPPTGMIDQRRIYHGTVTGHALQWVHIALQIRAGLRSLGRSQPAYLMEMAQELFERTRVDGWRRTDGNPGFATGIDADGEPLDGEDEHQQWVVCEGVYAAAAVRRAMLDDGASAGEVEHYEHCYRSFLDFINDYLITQPGRWARRLDAHNQPLDRAKASRWDVYHAVQATLAVRVPLWPPIAPALSRGLLDKPEEAPKDKKSWNFFGSRA